MARRWASALATLYYMGTQLVFPKGAQPPVFGPYDQMAGWIKMPLGMEVGLGPDNFVLYGLYGTQLPSPKRGTDKGLADLVVTCHVCYVTDGAEPKCGPRSVPAEICGARPGWAAF